MKKRSIKHFSGFTLIELLVVVLIIGILAAVAVPQYQKAVERSRAEEGVLALRNLLVAQKAYYLQNGHYATNLESLDIDIKIPQNFTITFLRDSGDFMTLQRKDTNYSYTLNVSNKDGFGYCYAAKADTKNIQICRSLGPAYNSDDTAERYYIF